MTYQMLESEAHFGPEGPRALIPPHPTPRPPTKFGIPKTDTVLVSVFGETGPAEPQK